MGMFDTVVIEGLKLDLPRKVKEFLKEKNSSIPLEFQTKDLENSLSTYKIDKNKQFWYSDRVPTGKKIKWNLPNFFEKNNSILEEIYWKVKRFKFKHNEETLIDECKEVLKKENITSTIFLYSYDLIVDRYLSLDYEVKIINGKVSSIKLKKWEIESDKQAQERVKRDLEFQEKLDKQNYIVSKRRSSPFYPLVREVYNPIIFFSRLYLQSIGNSLVKLSYKLNKL